MPDEASGIAPSEAWKRRAHAAAWYPGDTVITGIGQGYLLVTPLQLAAATATLANRGVRHGIHLLSKTQEGAQAAQLQKIQTLNPVILREPGTWEIVIEGMQAVLK